MITYTLSVLLGVLIMYGTPCLLWLAGRILLDFHRAGIARIDSNR